MRCLWCTIPVIDLPWLPSLPIRRGSRRACAPLRTFPLRSWTISKKGPSLSGRKRELDLEAVYGGDFAATRPPRHGTDHDSKPLLSLRGFVYLHAHFSADKKSIEVAVRPRKGSAAVCSRCHLSAPGYDQLAERRFEFIPLWGFLVFLLYTMRRVDCRRCGVVAVEEVPWGDGKRTLTKAYMLFLARWARRLSWKETAEAFRTSWDKVFDVRPDRRHRRR